MVQKGGGCQINVGACLPLTVRRSNNGVTFRTNPDLASHKSNNRVTFPIRHATQAHFDSRGMKTKLITILVAGLSCALGTVALAADPHTSGTKGQPSQSCQVTMVTPGHSATALGSAINPNGTAQVVYANPTSQGGISSGNTHVVAQYDVACFQQTMRELQQSARITERAARMPVGHGADTAKLLLLN